MAIGVVAAPSAADDARAILVVHTYGHDAPARAVFDATFARTMQEAGEPIVDLYVETLDPNRFAGEAAAQRTRAYLRERYAGKRLAVVVAVYDRGLAFLLDARDPLFPGVPVAALLTRYPQSPPGHVSIIWEGDTFGETAALALKLHPRTRQITIIDGALVSAASDAVHAEALRQVEAVAPNVAVTSLRSLLLDEVLARVQALPPEAIVILVRQLIGRSGATVGNLEAVKEVARVAPVPIYVVTDQLIDSGAVGGVVVSIENEARQLARLARRLAGGESLQPAPARGVPVPMFDWRQLRRWGIDERLLPAGSVVRFRIPSVWDQYGWYILGALAIVALQSALIAGLVVQGVRRRRMEHALRESEARFRLMADGAPVMVWTAKPDMATDFYNSTVLEFTGLSMEQLVGDGWLARIHPDDLEQSQRVYVPAFEQRQPFSMEYRFRRADGTYRWILDTGVPRYGPDGSFAGYIGSALDITERRKIELSLLDNQAALRKAYEENQDLAGRLIHAQEAERTRIARDLHDDLSQQLAGLAIMLSGLKRKVGQPDAQPEVNQTVTLLQGRTTVLAEAVRNLSHELHPSVLQHAGLVPALRRLCSEVEQHHRLSVTFSADDEAATLSPEVALCLFRVTQEALTNAVRHARASTIRVRLETTGDGVGLSVVDNGVGFVASERSRSGLGLRSIDERVRLTRGQVRLDSRPGQGTHLHVRIPLPAVDAELVREA